MPTEPDARRRWRPGVSAVVVASLALLSVAGLVAHHVVTSPCKAYPTSHVALPPVTASPQQVATTFVAALDAGDYDTMTALMSPQARADLWDSHSGVGPSYFGHICEIANFQVETVRSPGTGASSPGTVAYTPAQTADVIAAFDMVTKGTNDTFDGVFGAPAGRFDLTGGGAIRLGRDRSTDRWQVLQLDEDPA